MEIQNFEPQKIARAYVCMKISECPPPPPPYGGSLYISRGYSLYNFKLFLFSLNLTNSADPGEMQPYAAFHLDLHCLPKYLFRGFQNTKG